MTKKTIGRLLAVVLLGLPVSLLIIMSIGILIPRHIHNWKDGVPTEKYQQYMKRNDAIVPPVALYKCTKCEKILISGVDDSDIF